MFSTYPQNTCIWNLHRSCKMPAGLLCIPFQGKFSGDQMNASPTLPSQHLQPLGYSWERSVGNMVIHQALTSGSGTWQSTEDKPWSSSTASRPCRRRAGPACWSSVIVSPTSPSVRPPLPPLSLCLPPPPVCTVAIYSPGPRRSWVINDHRDADVFLSSTFCLLLRVSVLPLSVQRRGGSDHCKQPKPASLELREQPGR